MNNCQFAVNLPSHRVSILKFFLPSPSGPAKKSYKKILLEMEENEHVVIIS